MYHIELHRLNGYFLRTDGLVLTIAVIIYR